MSNKLKMNDLINRHGVAAWLENMGHKKLANYIMDENRFPSESPERKTGKWVYAKDEFGIDGNHCDQCGFFVPWDYIHTFINYIENYHYCPNCGVKMMKKGDNNG